MKLSIIIVNYNTDELTMQAVDSVLRHVKDVMFEVIVVDNNSKQTTLGQKFNSSAYKDVTFIKLKENKGFGKANNKGVEIANGEYIFLLNSDAYLMDDAVSKLIGFMEDKNNLYVASCAPNLINALGKPNLCYGNFLTKEKLLHELGIKKVDGKTLKEKLAISKVCDFEDTTEVDYLSGAALMIRKSVIDKFGLFNPKYFMYYEDMDLCFKYQSQGFKNVLVPHIKIVHIGGQSWISNKYGNYGSFKIIAKSKYLFSKNFLNPFEAFFFYVLDYLKFILQKLRRKMAHIFGQSK